MMIKLGSWELSVSQPPMDTRVLMSLYTRRAVYWKKVIKRLGMEKSYQKLWRQIPMSFPAESQVLDIGSGTGCLAQSFNNHYCHSEITLLDLNNEMLEQATKELAFPLKIIHANATTYRSKNKVYDVVICAHLIEHIDDPVKTFQHWRSCLHNDSYIVLIATRNKWFNRWLNLTWNLNLYRDDEIEEKLSCAGYQVCYSTYLPGFLTGKMSRVYIAQLNNAQHGV